MSRNWAIAIGINQYDYFKDLRYAVQDAAAMRDFCCDEVQFEKVYYFADDAEDLQLGRDKTFRAQPTSDNLENFLFDRFENKFLKPEDNLWFFFAGHGKQLNGRDYLVPSNANPRKLERPGLAVRNVTDRLRRSGAGNVVMFIDACRSEGTRDGRGVGDEKQQGVVTMFSCRSHESSYEVDELRQGVFTYALLQGLRIKGEGNCATVERLNQYLQVQVPNLCKAHGKVDEWGNALQMPCTRIEPMSKSHLILLTKQANPTDVNTLKMDAQEAELENQFDLAMELWTRVLAASNSKLDPQAINAFGRIALKREKFEQNLPPQTQPITPSQPFTSRQSPTTETTPPQRDIEFLPIISNKTFSFETVRINKPWIVMKRDQREAEYFPIDLGGSMTLDLVKIPAGSFMMGSPDGEGYSSEKPQNRVILKEFWIGKYPVTQAQWKQVVTVLPKIGQHLKSDPSYFKKDNCPSLVVT